MKCSVNGCSFLKYEQNFLGTCENFSDLRREICENKMWILENEWNKIIHEVSLKNEIGVFDHICWGCQVLFVTLVFDFTNIWVRFVVNNVLLWHILSEKC